MTLSDSTEKEVTPSTFDLKIQTIALVLESDQKMDVEGFHGQLIVPTTASQTFLPYDVAKKCHSA